ncbi:MAG TPA: GNAT family N-acetyltransferase [Burkholderiales bacterium]|nr:GNAT family N-acetyltransferase [Burkholderiales bacterium]
MDFPQRLRTPRLLFSRLENSDRHDFLRLRRDPRIAPLLDAPHATPAEDAFPAHSAHWAAHGFGWWAVREPHGNRFIGYGGLQSATVDELPAIDIAYAFLPECWGRGYASELVRVAVAQGFVRLNAREIVGFVHVTNAASRRVLERSGFRREREVARAGRPHGLYRLSARSWCAAPHPFVAGQRAATDLQPV